MPPPTCPASAPGSAQGIPFAELPSLEWITKTVDVVLTKVVKNAYLTRNITGTFSGPDDETKQEGSPADIVLDFTSAGKGPVTLAQVDALSTWQRNTLVRKLAQQQRKHHIAHHRADNAPPDDDADVIIVGSGAAGVACAIVSANDHVGGPTGFFCRVVPPLGSPFGPSLSSPPQEKAAGCFTVGSGASASSPLDTMSTCRVGAGRHRKVASSWQRIVVCCQAPFSHRTVHRRSSAHLCIRVECCDKFRHPNCRMSDQSPVDSGHWDDLSGGGGGADMQKRWYCLLFRQHMLPTDGGEH